MDWTLCIEGTAAGALFAAAIVLVVRRGSGLGRAGPSLVLALIAAAAFGVARWGAATLPAYTCVTAINAEIPAPLDAAEGFVTSAACRACHPGEYATWHATYHRTMTQRATPSAVLGDFDDVTLVNRGRTYRLFRKGPEYWVHMVDPDWEHDLVRRRIYPNHAPSPPRIDRRVVMTTGSHHQQTYWVAGDKGNVLYNLPFAWIIDERRWVPREDVFLRSPDYARQFARWNDNCIECHAVAGEMNYDADTGAARTQVAELGITCEACHGPARAHIERYANPAARYAGRLGDADAPLVNASDLDPIASSQVCGQCHGMNLFRDAEIEAGVRYRAGDDLYESRIVLRSCAGDVAPWEQHDWRRIERHIPMQAPTFLRDRFWSDGMVRVSGREHNAMTTSRCFTGDHDGVTCLSCHAMHAYESADDMLMPGMRGDAACIQCHADVAADPQAHTHHPVGSAGAACLNCHMPHTTYGLLKAIRSHEIDAPSVRAALATGRPDACSLCHMDKPLAWTAEHLNAWYGQPSPLLAAEHHEVSAAVLWGLRGDAGQRALIAWHLGWAPAVEASGDAWQPAILAELMDDPYAAVRHIAGRSLRAFPAFDAIVFDYVGPEPARLAATRRLRQLWTASAPPPAPNVLVGPHGVLDTAALRRILDQRDTTKMDLRE